MSRNSNSSEWNGRARNGPRGPFTWNAVLWALIYPRKARRIMPTAPGLVLVALSMGIGMAAYNSSSNILFLTLSLLLACLVLSGVLSWLNLRRVDWRLRLPPALRAGHDAVVSLELRNGRTLLPTYALWFNLVARPHREKGELRPESTVIARGLDFRAMWAQADSGELHGRVALSGRLEPGGEAQLEWVLRPAKRGRYDIELDSVGSLFPFGFLRKEVGTRLADEVIVWPAPIEYRRHTPVAIRRRAGDERAPRPGTGTDLVAVRRYTSGDSHRLIHWKASARMRQLLVRQFAAEASAGCILWIQTDAELWPRAEQFEVLVSFAATLAEDLFRAGSLLGVAVDDAPCATVRRIRELELVLDRLAVLKPAPSAATAPTRPVSGQDMLTFAPDGPRGVGAYVEGRRVASA